MYTDRKDITANEFLERFDKKEKFAEYEISNFIEQFQVMEEEGEDRRWSRTVSVLLQVNDRYFILFYERGLTENQDDEYLEQPIEVFTPKYAAYISYRTRVYNKEGVCVDSFEGLLNEHIEEEE